MKSRVILILALVILNLPLLFGHPDSGLLSYYPLQVGNYWEYQEEIRELLKDTSQYSYFSIEVVADTTMANGKKYMRLQRKSIPDTIPHEFIYERIDSTTFNIYRYDFYNLDDERIEFLIDSLMLPVGKSFEGYSRKIFNNFSTQKIPVTISKTKASQDTLFNDLLSTIHFSADNHIVFPDVFHYWLAEKIGVVRGFERETVWEYHLNLKYAEINGSIYGSPTSVEKTPQHNLTFKLSQNYPNPFNPSTTISYELPNNGEIELAVFNLLGQRIKTLFKGFQTAGIHQIDFDADNLAAGIYVYQIGFENQFQRRKLLLLR